MVTGRGILMLIAIAGCAATLIVVGSRSARDGLDQTAADRPSPSPAPAPRPRLNVLDYGAAADGVSDDVAAIKQAAAAAAAAGGGIVYLPAGTYLLSANEPIEHPTNSMQVHFVLPDHVTFRGAGMGRTVLRSTAPSYVSVFGSTGGSDLHVEDMTLTTDPALHPGDGDGIKLQDVTGSSFTNVAAESFYIDFMVYGSRRVSFTGCVARGRWGSGTGTSMNFVVDSFSPEVFPDTDGVSFVGCESSLSQQCGFWAYIANGGSAAFRVSNVTYRDCYAHDNSGAGFYSKWSLRATWSDCRSDRNGWGYYLVHAKEYLFEDCTAQGNESGGDAVPYDAGDSSARRL
jgi:hypothetical protein